MDRWQTLRAHENANSININFCLRRTFFRQAGISIFKFFPSQRLLEEALKFPLVVRYDAKTDYYNYHDRKVVQHTHVFCDVKDRHAGTIEVLIDRRLEFEQKFLVWYSFLQNCGFTNKRFLFRVTYEETFFLKNSINKQLRASYRKRFASQIETTPAAKSCS